MATYEDANPGRLADLFSNLALERNPPAEKARCWEHRALCALVSEGRIPADNAAVKALRPSNRSAQEKFPVDSVFKAKMA